MKKWLKDAFAVESDKPLELNTEQKAIVDRVCEEVARRHMTTPALIFLETFRPLNYLGSQVLHFFQPIVTTVLNAESYKVFTAFLEQRNSVDYLCRRIEYFEDLHIKNEKQDSSPASVEAITPADLTDEKSE